jgi:putative transferase (TIGR04331 family)
VLEKNKKRLLVTTPDETTWDLKRPLLFLGEWCKLFGKRDILKDLDIVLHLYHWDDRQKYQNDYKYLEKIYEQKLAELSIQLGNMHDVSTEIRYWRIIIGPWLRFFIDTVFDRYELIRTVAESDSVEDTKIHTYKLNDWIPLDFQEFYEQFRDDPWNHIIFAECIINSGMNFSILDTKIMPQKSKRPKQYALKKWGKRFLESYLNFFPASFNKISIVAAYIPVRNLIKFQKSLGQLPYISSPNIRINNKQTESAKRQTIVFTKAKTPFEQLLNKLIVALIPYAYIENFAALKDKSLARFPKHPKLILTANAYQADDGFKVWAAHHVNKKIPLILEQHGGHYGIGLLNQTEDHQLKIADTFASWGWKSKEHSNVSQMPSIKLSSGEIKYFNKKGDILMTIASYPRYFYCHYSVPVAGQMLDYIEEQIRFAKTLDIKILNSLKVRTDTGQFGWEISKRFDAAGIGSIVESSDGVSLNKRLEGCRISISTYNATVFLETLAANFPTLVFFDPKKYEFRPDVMPIMDKLRKVGILHNTPESASIFLNKLDNRIEEWWNGEILQITRKEFCLIFANKSPKWHVVWSTFLKAKESRD